MVQVNASDTLADADSLRMKEGLDSTASVEPLFHRLCALFDEGGAKGKALAQGGWTYLIIMLPASPSSLPATASRRGRGC
jgi:hypothetical protein